MVIIYKDLCSGVEKCPANGVCVTVCALDVISIVDGYPQIDDETCTSCELCVRNCPNEALII